MTNIAVIENKISSVKNYLTILEAYKKYSREEIEEDITIKGALERYLYLAVQATIDLSEAIVAYKKLRKPDTMSEAFYILSGEAIIDKELAGKLANMVGFRNVIAHDYTKLDYDIVYDVLHNKLKDIQKFLDIVSSIK